MKKLAAFFALIYIFCFSTCFPQESGNLNVSSYYVPAGSLPYPQKMPVLILKGGWREMGIKYGQEVAPFIGENYEATFSAWSRKPFGDKYLKECLNRFRSQIESLSPELVEFMKGVAYGAKEELGRAPHGKKLNNLDKILLLNVSFEMLEQDSWHANNLGFEYSGNGNPASLKAPYEGGTCWASLVPETFSHDVIIGFTRDCAYYPCLYQVALVVAPEDDDALRYMTTLPAGWVGTDFALNRMQLFVGQTKAGKGFRAGDRKCEVDFGVPATLISTYIAAFCRNSESAFEALTKGNASYLEKTGRSTLLLSRGANYLLVSPEKALVVERTAHHHYSRSPGKGENYLVITNDFSCPDSFNDDGMRTLIPMSRFGAGADDPAVSGGVSRKESVIHQIKSFRKRMTVSEAKENICSLSGSFAPAAIVEESVTGSEKMVSASETGAAVVNQAKWEGRPYFGTISSHLILLSALSMEFVLGPPWDWKGAWQQLRLYSWE